jgi:hypothetical protein
MQVNIFGSWLPGVALWRIQCRIDPVTRRNQWLSVRDLERCLPLPALIVQSLRKFRGTVVYRADMTHNDTVL